MNEARVTLAHGEGGRLMRRLIDEKIASLFDNPYLLPLSDAARLPRPERPIAITTDSFVVSPLFFPGGDIGKLAVFGTVNDLAVTGAKPLYLTLAMIVEEGLPMTTLESVLESIAEAANRLQLPVVAGDTKVVPHGAADKLFLNTTGVGEMLEGAPPGPSNLKIGDRLIVSGPIGRHGIAVLAARESLGLDPPPQSDCAPLLDAVQELLRAKVPVKAIRDATRGGIAAVLHEWSGSCELTLTVDEVDIPVTDEIRGVCELLGLDPIHVANEGTMLLAVAEEHAQSALNVLRELPAMRGAMPIGFVQERTTAPVLLRRSLGRAMPLDQPSGALLPRIC